MAKQPYNPANSTTSDLPKDFIPMTQGRLRLEVPERPGYHRHWFRDDPARIERAKQAGYVCVDPEDVSLNNFDYAGSGPGTGNSLGNIVSVVSGDGVKANGQPSHLILMECPIQYYEASMAVVESRNEIVAAALRGGKIGVNEPHASYNREAPSNLFTPKSKRS